MSDMHLGADAKPITGFSESHRPTPEFDENFIACLRYYTKASPEQWRVVLAGDFIDFVEVVVRPQDDTSPFLSFEVSKQEKSLGLNTEPERATVKLASIMDYHSALFRALAEFVRSGGELVMIRGNHDVEMFWGKVQRFMRQRLADIAFAGEHLELEDLLECRNQFQARVSFIPWCFIEPGRIYIEHGHQYDPYCSFDHQLYPVSPTNPKEIDTPLFMFAMRYFVNRLSDFATHYKDVWTTRDWFRWLRQKGIGGMLYTIGMAMEAAGRSLFYAVQFWLGRVGPYEDEHFRKMAEQAQRFGVSSEALERIDRLHYTPVNRNLGELMRLLFLDRLLLGAGMAALILFALWWNTNPWLEWTAVLLIVAGAYLVNRRLEPRRFLLPGPRQAYAARSIVDELGVKIVVMGHSHQRRKVPLGDGRWYVNTGCWLPPFFRKLHAPDDICTCNLSHLVVDGVDADLRIFCAVHKRPRSDIPSASPRVLTLESGGWIQTGPPPRWVDPTLD